MEDNVLSRVISVEKELQVCLEAERNKAREWLEGVRKEAEEEFARKEERMREAFRISAAQAKDEAMAKAGDMIKAAGEEAERLLNLSDETLRGTIMQSLNMVLPE